MPQPKSKYYKILSLKVGQHRLKARLCLPEGFGTLDPSPADWAVLHQAAELSQLTLLATTALARDLYSRFPEGSREFESVLKNSVSAFVGEDGSLIGPEDLLKS